MCSLNKGIDALRKKIENNKEGTVKSVHTVPESPWQCIRQGHVNRRSVTQHARTNATSPLALVHPRFQALACSCFVVLSPVSHS
jgi:hypothetical protein